MVQPIPSARPKPAPFCNPAATDATTVCRAVDRKETRVFDREAAAQIGSQSPGKPCASTRNAWCTINPRTIQARRLSSFVGRELAGGVIVAMLRVIDSCVWRSLPCPGVKTGPFTLCRCVQSRPGARVPGVEVVGTRKQFGLGSRAITTGFEPAPLMLAPGTRTRIHLVLLGPGRVSRETLTYSGWSLLANLGAGV